MLAGLDEPCATCGRVCGNHTLREWTACLGTVTTDLPFEATAPDLGGAAAAAVRERFELDDGIVIADHSRRSSAARYADDLHISAAVRAMTLTGQSGQVPVRVPALMHDFQIGAPGRPPETVASVAFLGNLAAMRGYGRLVRDGANGAANAAERAA